MTICGHVSELLIEKIVLSSLPSPLFQNCELMAARIFWPTRIKPSKLKHCALFSVKVWQAKHFAKWQHFFYCGMVGRRTIVSCLSAEINDSHTVFWQ